jgi:TolB protein
LVNIVRVALVKLFFLAWVLNCLLGCQPLPSGIDRKSHITYSTFAEDHGWQIWQADLKTLNTQQITWSKDEAYYPSWGPKGELAYSDHNGRIWLLKSGLGSEDQQAEQISSLPKYCGHPAISPDGKRLACVCFDFVNRSEDSDLYLVDLDSKTSERLIVLPGLQKYPAWSPDGQKLVFSSGYRESGEQIVEELWLMDFANKVPVKIVDNGQSNINPAWSPDGKRIAYSSNMNGSLDIWLYNLDAKQATPLTQHEAMEADPVWRPDGTGLMYLSTREGTMGLWEIDLATQQEKKLLLLKEDIHEPTW